MAAEVANFVRDEETYFALMNALLTVQVAKLNTCLIAAGVADSALRERICAEFGLAMGDFFDSGWMEVQGKKCYPLLMFSERFLTSARSLSDIGIIQAPPKTDEFHPLAVDAATCFFGELKENTDAVRTGVVEAADQ